MKGNQASAVAVGLVPTARAIKMVCAGAPSRTLEQRLPDALTGANVSRVILTLAVGFAWAHRFSWAGGLGRLRGEGERRGMGLLGLENEQSFQLFFACGFRFLLCILWFFWEGQCLNLLSVKFHFHL